MDAAWLFSRKGIAAFTKPHRAHQVGVEAALPAFLVAGDRQRADVGHHDVDAAERTGRVLHPGGQRRAVGHVGHAAAHGDAGAGDLGLGALHLVGVAGAEGHVRALGDQCVDDGAADALGAAGDHCLQALESEVHVSSFV